MKLKTPELSDVLFFISREYQLFIYTRKKKKLE